MAAVEAVTRNTPRFCFFITASAYLAPSQTPLTFTAMMRSNVASSCASMGVGNWGTPAFAKNTSRRPHAARAFSTSSWLSAARLTSARPAPPRPPPPPPPPAAPLPAPAPVTPPPLPSSLMARLPVLQHQLGHRPRRQPVAGDHQRGHPGGPPDGEPLADPLARAAERALVPQPAR